MSNYRIKGHQNCVYCLKPRDYKERTMERERIDVEKEDQAQTAKIGGGNQDASAERVSKTTERSSPPESGSVSFPPDVLPPPPTSSLTDLYTSEEFSVAWDNNTKHHIARNLLHLRRYRGKSQSDVARAIGTSQSAIAKIEAGEANFTVDTIERIIKHLRGRFFVRIQPEEFGFHSKASRSVRSAK